MAKPRIDVDALPSNNKTVRNSTMKVVSRGNVRIGNDGVSNKMRDVGNSIFDTVILPSLRSLLYETFINGLSMLIFGENTSSSRGGLYTPYNKRYSPRRPTSRRRIYREERRMEPNRRVSQTQEVFQDLYFEYREDAQLVLASLHDNIQEYGKATVGDYYALAGKNTNYTHQTWGWDDLSGVTIHPTADGFVIGLPDAIYFN